MRPMHNAVAIAFIMLMFTRATLGDADALLGDGRQPQVAVDPAGNVFVVHAKDGAIRVNTSSDGGKSFGDSVLVETVTGLPLGMRRGPRIAATKDSAVITAITGEKGGGKDGDVVAWMSSDEGKTWKKSAKPLNSVSGAAREGLHAMAAGADATVACVWLDLRNAKPGKPGTEIWCTVSKDGGKSWSQDKVIYRNREGTVCECCHPSVAIDGKGVITVMFRNSVSGARDMYLTTSKDGGKTFAGASKLGAGTWKLNACPMDGGAVAAQANSVVTIWRRDKTVYAHVPGKPEQQIAPTGSQPVIAAADDGVYAVWMDGGALNYQSPGRSSGLLVKTGAYPSVATAVDGKGPVVVVWEQDGKVAVRQLKSR